MLSNILAMRFKEADIDMTAEQWGALIVLLNGEPMTQVQLGERLCLEKSSVSRLINGLEKRDWIQRVRDNEDNRQKLVTPTPKVKKIAERCADIARSILEEAQLGMTEGEKLAFRSLLSRTISNLRELSR